ncbi:MAG: hypothetical protein ACOZQL_17280 [Myxococcota bacterium]
MGWLVAALLSAALYAWFEVLLFLALRGAPVAAGGGVLALVSGLCLWRGWSRVGGWRWVLGVPTVIALLLGTIAMVAKIALER